jgi:hypothetical protein
VLWGAACNVIVEAIQVTPAAWSINGEDELLNILLEAKAIFRSSASYPLMSELKQSGVLFHVADCLMSTEIQLAKVQEAFVLA